MSAPATKICTNPEHGHADPTHYAGGLCMACYKRLRCRGTLRRAQGLHRTCTVRGCKRDHVARGFCRAHWRSWKLYGDPRAARIRDDAPRLPRVPIAPVREFIKELERWRGLNHCQIAERAGISRRMVLRILNGSQRGVQFDTAERIATAFGRHVDEVFLYEAVS